MAGPIEWYKDNFFISTAKSLIDSTAVNAAFATEAIYWAKPMEEGLLKKMLDNSLCFGVYELPATSSAIAGRTSPRQIGLARVITDEVSFAYLTDVYILEEFQRKGLGVWLIQCVNQTLDSWPELRRTLLVTTDGSKFYSEHMGMQKFGEGASGDLSIMTKRGHGSIFED